MIYAVENGVVTPIESVYSVSSGTAEVVSELYSAANGDTEQVYSSEFDVTVQGGYQEQITISGTRKTVTVTCDSAGDGGTVSLPRGTYTVSSSYLSQALGTSRTVTVTPDQPEITSYPPGCLYWYGRKVKSFSTDFGWTAEENGFKSDYLRIYVNAPSYGPLGTQNTSYVWSEAVDLTDYTTAHMYVSALSASNRSSWKHTTTSGKPSVASDDYSDNMTGATGDKSWSVSGYSGNYCVGIAVKAWRDAEGNRGDRRVTIRAIWLE